MTGVILPTGATGNVRRPPSKMLVEAGVPLRAFVRDPGRAREAGREPKEVRRVYNRSGTIGPTGDGLLDGPASQWTEEITRFALDLGVDTFVYWPSGYYERQIDIFAREVVPTVREVAAAARA